MWTFDSDTDPGYWVPVESPTTVTLRDLTATANGPVAVGDEGVAIGRGQDRWGVILENGPGARSRTLHAVDASDDGAAGETHDGDGDARGGNGEESGNDPADQPDDPDGGSGNDAGDEPDPPDENTDSNADSPDSSA